MLNRSLSHRSRSAVGTAWNWTMASVRCTRGPRARQKALTGSNSGSMLGSFVRWLSSSAGAAHAASAHCCMLDLARAGATYNLLGTIVAFTYLQLLAGQSPELALAPVCQRPSSPGCGAAQAAARPRRWSTSM